MNFDNNYNTGGYQNQYNQGYYWFFNVNTVLEKF